MKSLILRYAKSKVDPATLWYDWLSVRDRSLDKLLDKAARIQGLTRSRKATKGYLKVKVLSDNVKSLVKDYDRKMQAFKGQTKWTPELEARAKELARDRNFMGRLKLEPSGDIGENISSGLEKYLSPFSAEKERDTLTDLFMEASPEDIVAYAKTLDFRKEEAGLNKFLQIFPEARNIFEESSPKQYREWVKHLERSVGNEDAFYNDWEDLLPGWDPELATENLDLSEFDTLNKNSPLYWYEWELGRRADQFWAFK